MLPAVLRNNLPIIALFVVFLVWGTTMGFIHIGVTHLSPGLFVTVRFWLAGLLLLAWCRFRGEAFPNWNNLKQHGIIAILLYILGHAVNYWTLKYIPVGINGMISATNPFWMLWLTAVLPPNESIPKRAWLGVALGFVGMGVLLSPQWQHLDQLPRTYWLSIALSAVGTMFWSLGSIYSRKRQPNDSLLMSVGIQNLIAALILTPICLWPGSPVGVQWSMVQVTPLVVWCLVYLILFGTILTTTCYLYVLQTLSVPLISTIAYVTPLVTLAFGYWVLHEPISPIMGVGIAIVLSGVFLVQGKRKKV
jgi:drug/metabolite transporter (DMT)-like permease